VHQISASCARSKPDNGMWICTVQTENQGATDLNCTADGNTASSAKITAEVAKSHTPEDGSPRR
jgi:hypothetical protein